MNFESAFKNHLKKHFASVYPAQKLLQKSLFYTLTAKASRFRPRLCFATSKALGQKPEKILPWAIALEMIHCASLIHDDLPLMDNAQNRRGKKCNHLVFGEDIALLAGTCLFIESFSLLKAPLFNKKRKEFLDLLISKIGFKGLMSGQALDLKGNFSSKPEFLKMIRLKTGNLIEACVLGPLLLWGKTEKEKKALQNYSKHLGIAYQLADDLKDKDGFFKSKKQTVQELNSLQKKMFKALNPLGKKGEELKQLSTSVCEREKAYTEPF